MGAGGFRLRGFLGTMACAARGLKLFAQSGLGRREDNRWSIAGAEVVEGLERRSLAAFFYMHHPFRVIGPDRSSFRCAASALAAFAIAAALVGGGCKAPGGRASTRAGGEGVEIGRAAEALQRTGAVNDAARGPDGAAPADGGVSRAAGTLTIYFVDVEGGQATVVALPNGQVLVVDAGNPGARDGERLLAVLRDELGVSTVDYLLITHYHGDHVGGVPYLASKVSVAQYLDHGDRAFGGQPGPAEYLALANAASRRVVVAGDVLSLGGVELSIVAAGGGLIREPLAGGGAPNPFCAGAQAAVPGDPQDENVNSVGFVLRFGAFDFLDLGDLLWFQEHELACPVDRLGPIDLYLTTHHGLTRSGARQLVRGIEPLAAIMNNGPRKGGGGSTWETLALAPGGANVWQLHRVVNATDDHNAPPDHIVNLEEGPSDPARYLKVSVERSGRFTIVNPRTQLTKSYGPR
jgi:competence protein ComEC